MEHEAIPLLRDAIVHCENVRDFVSRDLFASILSNEEEHVDILETQFEMIAQMGLENYVQLQSRADGGLRLKTGCLRLCPSYAHRTARGVRPTG